MAKECDNCGYLPDRLGVIGGICPVCNMGIVWQVDNNNDDDEDLDIE